MSKEFNKKFQSKKTLWFSKYVTWFKHKNKKIKRLENWKKEEDRAVYCQTGVQALPKTSVGCDFRVYAKGNKHMSVHYCLANYLPVSAFCVLCMAWHVECLASIHLKTFDSCSVGTFSWICHFITHPDQVLH